MKKILLMLLVLASVVACGDSSLKLKTDISKSASIIQLKNNDTFPYKKANVEINGKYKYRCKKLDPGQTIEIGLLNFSDSDGNRFNPLLQKVLSVTVSCNVAEKGSDDYKFGFVYGEFN